MAISKIQSGDRVRVITGKYKGTIGVVTKVKSNIKKPGLNIKRVSISTIPKITKYRKAFSYQGESYPGQKLLVDRFLDISNVSLVTVKDVVSKSRIESKDGKKTRVLKKTGEAVIKDKIVKLEEDKQ